MNKYILCAVIIVCVVITSLIYQIEVFDLRNEIDVAQTEIKGYQVLVEELGKKRKPVRHICNCDCGLENAEEWCNQLQEYDYCEERIDNCFRELINYQDFFRTKLKMKEPPKDWVEESFNK